MERRKSKRHKLSDCPGLRDRILGVVIGRILDVSTDGLRLVTDRLIEEGSRLKCRLQLAEEIDGEMKIDFDICCAWSKKNTLHGAYEAGFKFAAISEADLGRILKLAESCQKVPV